MAIPDDPKSALESYLEELEDDYYSWYSKATVRNYWIWLLGQGTTIAAGLLTAVVAALASEDALRSFGVLRVLLVILPLIGTLAATFLLQTRVRELFALREKGRQSIQSIASRGRIQFAACSKPQDFTLVHTELEKEVGKVEAEQNLGFFSIVPDLAAGKPR